MQNYLFNSLSNQPVRIFFLSLLSCASSCADQAVCPCFMHSKVQLLLHSLIISVLCVCVCACVYVCVQSSLEQERAQAIIKYQALQVARSRTPSPPRSRPASAQGPLSRCANYFAWFSAW